MAGAAHRSPRKRSRIGRVLGLPILAFVAWSAGLVHFAETLPRSVASPETRTDAVVVLTGGSERIAEGIEILATGRAGHLFISGVYRGVDVDQLLRLLRQDNRNLECCMSLGHDADNTRGNALETARWMAREEHRSLRLVTATYHMPRSLVEFRRSLPEAQIVPHPVFPEGFRTESWWRWPGTFRLLVLEYNKYLLALIRPW